MFLENVFEKNIDFINRTELSPDYAERCFEKSETRDHLVIGKVSLPTGRIRLGDPFSYMCSGEYSPELARTVKPGEYPVEIALSKTFAAGLRIAAVRVVISEKSAVRYELAESTHETAVFHCSDGDLSGFPVDAGMMAIMDSAAMEEYVKFCEDRNKNIYSDYFESLFAQSYEKLPEYQRKGGDFIEWTVPDTELSTVMMASGFGDGIYQSFWGIDEEGGICSLFVALIDCDMAEEMDREYRAIWDGPEYCVITNNIAQGRQIGYMRRDEPSENFADSGWMFYGVDEDEEYWDNADNFGIFSIHTLAEKAPEIVPLIKSPVGAAYFRDESGRLVPDEEDD